MAQAPAPAEPASAEAAALEPEAPVRARVGRPPRLDRAMIAEAAYEIGLDQVTMKGVAQRLGVSVPGLYHHVEGRDDLMRLAAEYSASRLLIPTDHGQHWTEWLLEWALHTYRSFSRQPELLNQFSRGAMSFDRMVDHLDAVIGLLTRQGFSPAEAREAYTVVSGAALGSALQHIRHSETGDEVVSGYHAALATRAPDDLPNLRQLVASTPWQGATVEYRLCTVLIGIAVRRGEPWAAIVEMAPGRSLGDVAPPA